MRPVVLTLEEPCDPVWVTAHSTTEIQSLVSAGHTVVVTPALIAARRAEGHPESPAPGHRPEGGEADSETGGEAAELAAASICAWLGARVFRTSRPDAVRQALDMTESLAGRRPPAVTRRGLA
ncbi:hypothetical protein SAMN05421505_109106 [Sinosporangium album]|uniref:Uncharacterized protein n=1 Tax=Sinosporangium album TaxID=504805 RepID=A0A1G7Y6T9_9ACTN|nr:hypothetical protein [Sinosporangium album]SDG91690.1 hypothetical protein SAMN05421505_109106 [Sinosporangium album]